MPYPFVELHIKCGELQVQVSALVDTGFNDGLIIPMSELARLGAPGGFGQISLANGEHVFTEIFFSTIPLRGREFVLRAFCMGNDYVIGQQVIRNFRICFDHGKQVQIED